MTDDTSLLERACTEARRRLAILREAGDALQVALVEADLNWMLDELQLHYERRKAARRCST